jgi:hypothetical protein
VSLAAANSALAARVGNEDHIGVAAVQNLFG